MILPKHVLADEDIIDAEVVPAATKKEETTDELDN